MAKIKTGGVVSEIKGTLGGVVFAANKGGNYARRYKKGTNANTTKQQVVRNLFGNMAGLWRSLTDAQRASWIEGAVNFPYTDNLGEVKVYSGQQLFNKLNNNLAQIGASLLVTCPSPQSFPAVAFASVANTVTSNTLELTIEFDGNITVPVGFEAILNATSSLSAGISAPQKARFKKITTVAAGSEIDSLSIITDYSDNFGALVLNDCIFLSVSLVNTRSGEASVAQFIKTVRVA